MGVWKNIKAVGHAVGSTTKAVGRTAKAVGQVAKATEQTVHAMGTVTGVLFKGGAAATKATIKGINKYRDYKEDRKRIYSDFGPGVTSGFREEYQPRVYIDPIKQHIDSLLDSALAEENFLKYDSLFEKAKLVLKSIQEIYLFVEEYSRLEKKIDKQIQQIPGSAFLRDRHPIQKDILMINLEQTKINCRTIFSNLHHNMSSPQFASLHEKALETIKLPEIKKERIQSEIAIRRQVLQQLQLLGEMHQRNQEIANQEQNERYNLHVTLGSTLQNNNHQLLREATLSDNANVNAVIKQYRFIDKQNIYRSSLFLHAVPKSNPKLIHLAITQGAFQNALTLWEELPNKKTLASTIRTSIKEFIKNNKNKPISQENYKSLLILYSALVRDEKESSWRDRHPLVSKFFLSGYSKVEKAAAAQQLLNGKRSSLSQSMMDISSQGLLGKITNLRVIDCTSAYTLGGPTSTP